MPVVCAGSAKLTADPLAAASVTALDEARERLRAALRAGQVLRTARGNTFVLGACCGTATSATLFHLMTNRYARVIGVDRDKAESCSFIIACVVIVSIPIGSTSPSPPPDPGTANTAASHALRGAPPSGNGGGAVCSSATGCGVEVMPYSKT